MSTPDTMTLTEVRANPEQLARLFHDLYEKMAPAFGYETRPETRQFDPQSQNGRLMVAVCGVIADRLRER